MKSLCLLLILLSVPCCDLQRRRSDQSVQRDRLGPVSDDKLVKPADSSNRLFETGFDTTGRVSIADEVSGASCLLYVGVLNPNAYIWLADSNGVILDWTTIEMVYGIGVESTGGKMATVRYQQKGATIGVLNRYITVQHGRLVTALQLYVESGYGRQMADTTYPSLAGMASDFERYSAHVTFVGASRAIVAESFHGNYPSLGVRDSMWQSSVVADRAQEGVFATDSVRIDVDKALDVQGKPIDFIGGIMPRLLLRADSYVFAKGSWFVLWSDGTLHAVP